MPGNRAREGTGNSAHRGRSHPILAAVSVRPRLESQKRHPGKHQINCHEAIQMKATEMGKEMPHRGQTLMIHAPAPRQWFSPGAQGKVPERYHWERFTALIF